jgi:hypothetical protein
MCRGAANTSGDRVAVKASMGSNRSIILRVSNNLCLCIEKYPFLPKEVTGDLQHKDLDLASVHDWDRRANELLLMALAELLESRLQEPDWWTFGRALGSIFDGDPKCAASGLLLSTPLTTAAKRIGGIGKTQLALEYACWQAPECSALFRALLTDPQASVAN